MVNLPVLVASSAASFTLARWKVTTSANSNGSRRKCRMFAAVQRTAFVGSSPPLAVVICARSTVYVLAPGHHWMSLLVVTWYGVPPPVGELCDPQKTRATEPVVRL